MTDKEHIDAAKRNIKQGLIIGGILLAVWVAVIVDAAHQLAQR